MLYYNDTGADYFNLNLQDYMNDLGIAVKLAMNDTLYDKSLFGNIPNNDTSEIELYSHITKVEFCAIFNLILNCNDKEY